MFGLSETGFKRKRYIDVLTTMQSNTRDLFGADINLNDNSLLGMILKVAAFALGTLWQVAEDVFYSAFKDTATGIALDWVCQYVGITRKPADRARGSVIFTGKAGTVIPANYIVAAGNVQFWTLKTVTISEDGTIGAEIMALEAGTVGNVQPGMINTLFRALTGVTAVVNTLATTGGDATESDAELRVRYDKSLASSGSSTAESIEAALLAVADVTDAIVTENDTVAVVDGIPPKSTSAFVYGGIDVDVANAIYKTKAGGIQAYGTTVLTVTDKKGIGHSIGFTRPTVVPVYVHVTLTKEDSEFPPGGDTTIQTAIIAYIGGLAADSVEYRGAGLSEDIIYTKIIGLCHKVAGVTDVAVTLSTDNITFTSGNVAIGAHEVALTEVAKVVVS